MRVGAYLRIRGRRGWTLSALGPNEARILFDLVLAASASAASLLFLRIFFPATPTPIGRTLVLLPAAFMAFNAAAGIYSYLKLARSTAKALALAGSTAATVLAAWLLGVPPVILALWTLLTAPTAIAARLLLGLPYSRRAPLNTLVVTRHGPVLVIGGAGYIGSLTVERLLHTGHRVRVLDRLMYGTEPLAAFAGSPHFELLEGDVTDISKLTAAMRHASAVIHLAGLVGDPACAVDPEFTRHANIIATRMAKEVAQSLGIHRFIFASSCSVYGASDKEMREGDDLNPVSLYAQTKIDSERELLFSVRDDFFVTVLRFATVFGHSSRPRFDLVANLFAAQAMMNGLITVIGPDQWRPFIHVRDLARAIVMVLDARAELVQSQIFNVGDTRLNMTIGQLGELVQRTAGAYRDVRLQISEGDRDRRNYRVSFEKIRTTLGFEAETTLEAGVREMVDALRAGTYGDFRNPVYSNVATTRAALHDFYESNELYAPRRAS
ncbi:MAG TPA: NAD(P)-dependent oxidoreductase [Vicinamibacterales bacterium]|jgi:nucleoside-diphosphate-sugar epimerase